MRLQWKIPSGPALGRNRSQRRATTKTESRYSDVPKLLCWSTAKIRRGTLMVVFLGTFSLWIHLLGLGPTVPGIMGKRPHLGYACHIRGVQDNDTNTTWNATVAMEQTPGISNLTEEDQGEEKAIIFHDTEVEDPNVTTKLPFHEYHPSRTHKVAMKPKPQPAQIVKQRRIGRPRPKYRNISCNGCFKRNFSYLNLPKNVCRKEGQPATEAPSLDMVMTILSRPGNRLVRDVVRGTWATASRNNTAPSVRHVFLLGAAKDTHEQGLVDAENRKYNDIVQSSFVDHYDNLTYKMLLMHDWATAFCDNARYVFKVDEDVFVNVSRVLTITRKESSGSHLLGRCNLHTGPIRSPKSKWVMPAEQYSQEAYPPFCLGPRYLVPLPVSRAVLAVSQDTPKIRLEDVYLGMLLAKTPYTVKDLPELESFRVSISAASACSTVDKVTTMHGIRNTYLSAIWLKCYQPGQPKYMRGREHEAAISPRRGHVRYQTARRKAFKDALSALGAHPIPHGRVQMIAVDQRAAQHKLAPPEAIKAPEGIVQTVQHRDQSANRTAR